MVIAEHADVVGLAPGTFHTMLVKQDGSLWSTAVHPDARSKNFIKSMSTGVVAAAACNYYSIVLKQDGGVWTTGQNSKGQLGIFQGSATNRYTFSLTQVIPGAKTVAVGGYHSMILTRNGQVWVSGWNRYGQLGDGSKHDRTIFILTNFFGAKAAAVAAGDVHSMVMKQDGSVWAAGQNYNGQLGDGSKADARSFVRVKPSGATDVAAGGYHSMVLKQDGSVWATGWNKYGQLGDGSTTERIDYVQVVLRQAKGIAAGSRHSMMLKLDGSVWATGYNIYGQLGDGGTTNSGIFVEVMSDGATTIAAGALHSMVLKQDGSIWATGSNKDGQLGHDWRTSEKIFVRLEPFGPSICIWFASICLLFRYLTTAMCSTVDVPSATHVPSSSTIDGVDGLELKKYILECT